MTVRRLFAPALGEAGEVLELPAESVRHAHVLRLAAGAPLVLFDGRLGEADGELLELGRERARAGVLSRRQVPAPEPALHVVLALPKGGKLEDIARMFAELGVSSLQLAHSERSVPKLEQPDARMARLGRVAIEACAQSGQPWALQVHTPANLLEVAGRAPAHAQRLVFWEDGSQPFGAATFDRAHEHWAVIGPEGGLSAREVSALEGLGYRALWLGRARLRVETAAAVIAGLVLERLGRLR